MDKLWEKTDLHCPGCGAAEVWERQDGGDYYLGQTHLCMACIRAWNVSESNYRVEDLAWECAGIPPEIVTPPEPETELSRAMRGYYEGPIKRMLAHQLKDWEEMQAAFKGKR